MSDLVDGVGALQERLGHRFERRSLLLTALTHKSYANEQGLDEDYERLEFLGDAVLALVTADWLIQRYDDRGEGELSLIKSYLVSEPVLARLAALLGLGEALRLGVGEERSGGREKPSLLADALEAVLGAVFLDGGLEAAARVARPLLAAGLASSEPPPVADPKMVLQELAHARGWEVPEYRHLAAEGPDHSKLFSAECWVRGEALGAGRGRTKKRAEQRAAAAALVALDRG